MHCSCIGMPMATPMYRALQRDVQTVQLVRHAMYTPAGSLGNCRCMLRRSIAAYRLLHTLCNGAGDLGIQAPCACKLSADAQAPLDPKHLLPGTRTLAVQNSTAYLVQDVDTPCTLQLICPDAPE
jgi:hypothetical protein